MDAIWIILHNKNKNKKKKFAPYKTHGLYLPPELNPRIIRLARELAVEPAEAVLEFMARFLRACLRASTRAARA